MSADLVLKSACSGCGSTSDLYGSNCKHLTLCLGCGKTMTGKRHQCSACGAILTRLIQEYDVRASTFNDKNYSIGRFATGLPSFSKKKKNAKSKWSLHKDGLQGRKVTDALREKYKNKPWMLKDECGECQYQGNLEGAQIAIYYLLILQGKEFSAIPVGSWYKFNKDAQYKQRTLEEAEEKIKNRKKTADGYQRWMMKAANNGSALFGEVEKFGKDNGAAGGKGRKKTIGGDDDNEGNVLDAGDEDDEEELERKNRLNKRGSDDNNDDEGARGGDAGSDDDVEKGDDWEHDEIFSDDDETFGNILEKMEDWEPEVPAPPEIQDDDDEDEDDKEGGVLSKSGKELKKLLGQTGGLNDSDAEDDNDDDVDNMEDDTSGIPQVLAPKQPKQEPSDNNPSTPVPPGPAQGTQSTSKSADGKRKLNGDNGEASNNIAPPKKVKTENEQKPSIKEEPASCSISSVPPKPKGTPLATSSGGPVTEEEIRSVLMQRTPLTTQDLVDKFKGRLRSQAEKQAFRVTLKRICKLQKTNGSQRCTVVLIDQQVIPPKDSALLC